ncbi:protein phosphatase [Sanguibacter gelidistatuariae]|uniref:Protein phosphatase n=1 Tax=Sanguibacter gelidistatuariae TaxID=1814289 RepID=A0A1G6UNR1_9MICO|nr:protein phosphatase 2C domain-containing protein [Sanguibacter gelidistatuariae]SDD43028.1 protein phosphatase [Sanguibacter gelidistatuariae]
MYTAWGSATDTGRVRTLNEDALVALAPIFLVADGMGGHDSGDVASRIVVEECSVLAGRPFVTIDDLQQCFSRASTRMRGVLAGRNGGATVAGAAIAMHDGAAYWLVFNIGDSRVYRMVDSVIEQVTVDHSVVQELLEAGELSAVEASVHADRHVVTRALATDSASEPDYWMIPATRDDRLLICSDGLTDELTDAQIQEILLRVTDAQEAAEALVAAALDAGGRDNVSVVVVDVAIVWHGLTADQTHSYDPPGPNGRVCPEAPADPEWDEQMHGITQPRMRGGDA